MRLNSLLHCLQSRRFPPLHHDHISSGHILLEFCIWYSLRSNWSQWKHTVLILVHLQFYSIEPVVEKNVMVDISTNCSRHLWNDIGANFELKCIAWMNVALFTNINIKILTESHATNQNLIVNLDLCGLTVLYYFSSCRDFVSHALPRLSMVPLALKASELLLYPTKAWFWGVMTQCIFWLEIEVVIELKRTLFT